MASLDIKNLVKNIPLDETIEKLYEQRFFDDNPVHSLIKKDLKELFKFASYESLSTFDNEYYCQ